MRQTILRCTTCGLALHVPGGPGTGTVGCTQCGHPNDVWLFPALFDGPAVTTAEPLTDDGQSSCMNHPQNVAVTVCDGCGKYLCGLCDIDWNGEHLCTRCVATRNRTDSAGTLRTEYVHYDSIALLLAAVSMLVMLGPFFAPVTLYVAWRHWNTPWRPVPYWKLTMVLAVIVSLLVLLFWFSIFAYTMAGILASV